MLGRYDIDARLVLDNTSEAIVLLDTNWRYIYANHAAEMLLRLKAEHLLGRIHGEQYPSLIGTPAEHTLRRAMSTGRTVTFEQFLPGLYAWHAVKAVPSSFGLMLLSCDITDRVRALRDSAVREGMRSILERVPVAITITRGQEHRIELQNAYSRSLVNGRDLEGTTLANAIPEAKVQGFIAVLDKVFATGEVFVGKEMLFIYDRDASGREDRAYFDITYQPIFETDGHVSGILHLALNVSKRRLEKDTLSRFAAERDATLRQLSEGVILTDRDGRITFINERARQLHGLAVLDVSVDAYAETYQLLTLAGDPNPPSELPLARAVLSNEVVDGAKWRIRRPDGTEIDVQGSAQPVFDDEGQKIACVLTMRALSGP